MLAALGWAVAPLRWTPPPAPPEPVVELQLRASLGGAARAAHTTPPVAVGPRVATTAAAPLSPAPARPAPAAPISPAPAAPGPPAAAPSRSAAGRGPGAAGPGEAAGVQGALRGLLGCAHAGAVDLTAEEKARCAEQLGLARRTAPRVDPIPAVKRAYYDAVAQAYAETHFYGTPMPPASSAGGFDRRGVIHQWREGVPPGHALNAGCSPLFLLPGYKPPPHSLKLGPCVVTPPRGTFTEEADIADPPTLREREADAAHMRGLDAPAPPPAPSPFPAPR